MSVTLDIRNQVYFFTFSYYLKIRVQGKRWTITQESTFKTISQEFELDREFEETTADGRKFMLVGKFLYDFIRANVEKASFISFPFAYVAVVKLN